MLSMASHRGSPGRSPSARTTPLSLSFIIISIIIVIVIVPSSPSYSLLVKNHLFMSFTTLPLSKILLVQRIPLIQYIFHHFFRIFSKQRLLFCGTTVETRVVVLFVVYSYLIILLLVNSVKYYGYKINKIIRIVAIIE